MDDPDVPKNLKADGMFDHWVVYNIDPSAGFIAENATPPGEVGLNTAGQNVYYGACPPDRQHRYFFKLYALNAKLTLKPNEATKAAVEKAMDGHIIDKAQLIGLYERK
jgi:Raf kinase inhibitor-like YbhB/YbcL family protein